MTWCKHINWFYLTIIRFSISSFCLGFIFRFHEIFNNWQLKFWVLQQQGIASSYFSMLYFLLPLNPLPSDKILCTGLYLNKMVGKLVTGFMLLDIQRFWYAILSWILSLKPIQILNFKTLSWFLVSVNCNIKFMICVWCFSLSWHDCNNKWIFHWDCRFLSIALVLYNHRIFCGKKKKKLS